MLARVSVRIYVTTVSSAKHRIGASGRMRFVRDGVGPAPDSLALSNDPFPFLSAPLPIPH